MAKEIPAARVLDTLEVIMGPGKKDERGKEETVRNHWSTYPVHACLHTYYKLASNLMDLHRNYKDGKGEEAPPSKRPRSYSSTTERGESHTSSYNPPKKKNEEGSGMTEGGHKECRHCLCLLAR